MQQAATVGAPQRALSHLQVDEAAARQVHTGDAATDAQLSQAWQAIDEAIAVLQVAVAHA